MSPDHNAMIGEAKHVSRFLYATGFSGHGFLQGAGDRRDPARPRARPRARSSTSSPMSADRFDGGLLAPEFHVV